MGIMRNALFATASLAFVSSPAMAADMMSVGVGGYMEQWFGYADRDDGAKGGFKNDSDAELYFTGSLESDMGLTFGVDVQLEANNGPKEYTHPATGANNLGTGSTNIDESFAWVSGDFGRLEIGARDSIQARTHVGPGEVGVGINAGDTQVWIPGAYFDTYGYWVGMGDNKNIIYISPRVQGLQVGLSYGADNASENKWAGAPTGDEEAVWAAGLNFQQAFGDGTFSFSLGHRNKEGTPAEHDFITGMQSGDNDYRLTAGKLASDEKAVADYLATQDLMLVGKAKTVPLLDTATGNEARTAFNTAATAQNAILNATDGMMMKGDDDTFTNVGVGVSFGAFTFGVAYATRDRGSYMVMRQNKVLDANSLADRRTYTALLNQQLGYSAADGTARTADFTAPAADAADVSGSGGTYYFNAGTTADPEYVAESATMNDPDNDLVQETVVKNGAAEWDTWGVSVTYADGPMALSLSHMNLEDGAGGERTGTMLSARYALAPGVDWRTSVFTVEDSTGQNLGANEARQDVNEGTAFVTGIRIGF